MLLLTVDNSFDGMILKKEEKILSRKRKDEAGIGIFLYFLMFIFQSLFLMENNCTVIDNLVVRSTYIGFIKVSTECK